METAITQAVPNDLPARPRDIIKKCCYLLQREFVIVHFA